jgi:hypothetical protein
LGALLDEYFSFSVAVVFIADDDASEKVKQETTIL